LNAPDDDQEAHLEMRAISFGAMDPCDWAATLSTKLLAASRSLSAAREHYADPRKDLTHLTDFHALAAIRSGVCEYLSQMFVMLNSMPMMQSQPEILESLQFIIAGVADLDRGNPTKWLTPALTKKHPKRLEKEKEWVPIIAAMELLQFDSRFNRVDTAAKEIARRTDRTVGAIKDWHRKLWLKGKDERPVARQRINEEIQQLRAVLTIADENGRKRLIDRRVAELLK
jgi:hypothetical protein